MDRSAVVGTCAGTAVNDYQAAICVPRGVRRYPKVCNRPAGWLKCPAWGAELGIIDAEETPPSVIKPTGAAKTLPNFAAEVSFAKGGFDGVDLERQRAAETAWTYLAFDSVSPYIDTRPPLVANQAEQRRYRLRYRDVDVPVGEFSDTLSVTVGP